MSEAKRLNFRMYPNPALDRVTIQLPSGSEIAEVEFYDNIGRLTLTQQITKIKNEISVNNLSRGVYVIKVLSDNKIGSEKFIKQ